MKKILFALLFAVLISTGAFAQLMIGLSGALHMDSQLSARDIRDRFQQGDGIFYGPTIELAGKHLGVGVAGNMSFYTRDLEFYDGMGGTYFVPYKFTDYDLTLYLSYHLFGARAFLDPFGEFGGGILATGFTDKADREALSPYDSNFFMASYYWYGALGLGVNLGVIGLYGKFAYNYPLSRHFKADLNPAVAGSSGSADLLPYGYDEVLFPNGYLPRFRFTAGIKLIL
jgi:hypothetical protein